MPDLPEERVRQKCLLDLLSLGYPKSHIGVEIAVERLSPKKIGHFGRRIDLVCFYKKGTLFLPLLLIECKAVKDDEKAFRQLSGYNEKIGAPFLGVANEIFTLYWREAGKQKTASFLPRYEELIQACKL